MKKSLLLAAAALLLAASAAMAGQKKVEICHVPPGNPDNAHTISVAAPAVAVHQAQHGDVACSCEAIDECEAQGGIIDEATCTCDLFSGLCEPCDTPPGPDGPELSNCDPADPGVSGLGLACFRCRCELSAGAPSHGQMVDITIDCDAICPADAPFLCADVDTFVNCGGFAY